MNKVIYKYPLRTTDEIIKVDMPINSEIITMREQGGIPTLWAITDKIEPGKKGISETRMFEIYATGQEIYIGQTIQRKYIGTFDHAGFVGHVFELITPKFHG